MVEGASPVCATATDAAAELGRLRDAMRDGRRDARGRRTAPDRRLRRGRARARSALRPDPRVDARAARAHSDVRAARPRRDAGPRDGDRGVQPPAQPSPAAAGARRPLTVLARPRLRLRDRSRAAVPRLPARRDPARVRGLGRLLRGRRAWCAAGALARLHVPVVGHPAAPEARHGRGAGDGRAVAADVGGRPRRARPRARRRLRRRPRRRRVRRGADRVLVPRRPRRPRGDDLVGGSAAPAAPRSRPRRSPSPARTRAAAGSRRSSGSCATATARTACAAGTRPAACRPCWRTS